MALLDTEQRCIVLRAVYDGPALAGKTTNLRSLAKSLGADIYSAEEAEGRTLYFDWVDYVGGLFEGLPIRCQIVSVPGQQVLQSRRRMLLETADVVVFVADSRPGQLESNVRSFALLQEVMGIKDPALGIVVQANKRDVAGGVSLDTLQEALNHDVPLAMTSASAERGEGVRETFILAVRLALDRVRELQERQALPRLSPDVDDGPGLLEAMQTAEMSAVPSLTTAAYGGAERRASESSGVVGPGTATADPPGTSRKALPSATNGPLFPSASVPPGLVWPPVEGRVRVHESARAETRLERSPGGDWLGYSAGWKLRAPLEGLFFEPEPARAALLGWVRWHVSVGGHMSENRSLVLMPEANGVWRLWQIVRRVPSLHDLAKDLFSQSDDVVLGRGLFRIIDLRLRAQKELVVEGRLGRLDLASVGISDAGAPMFIGFSPYPGEYPGPQAVSFDETRLLRTELVPFVHGELKLAPRRLPTVLASFQDAASQSHRSEIAAAIQQILLGR